MASVLAMGHHLCLLVSTLEVGVVEEVNLLEMEADTAVEEYSVDSAKYLKMLLGLVWSFVSSEEFSSVISSC
ncbi:hypothetical protein V6N13_014499 [Hibiscus sabdariffa]